MRRCQHHLSCPEEDQSGRDQRRTAFRIFVLAIVAIGVVSLIASGTNRAGTLPCDARAVADKAMPSVVTIYANSSSGAGGNGSGEFLDEDGHILTNNHVISAAVGGGSITVLRPNGEELPATLVGRDPQTDLAVLKVDPVADVAPVTFGSALPVGAQVFAIGAPMGLADTFTAGAVSGLDRSVRVPSDGDTTALLVAAIQTMRRSTPATAVACSPTVRATSSACRLPARPRATRSAGLWAAASGSDSRYPQPVHNASPTR